MKYMFISLFILIANSAYGMETPQKKAEPPYQYTIMKFSGAKEKCYQVAFKYTEEDKVGFVAHKRKKFEEALDDLKICLHHDPEMTGKLINRHNTRMGLFDFATSFYLSRKEVSSRNKLQQIKDSYQDEMFLKRKHLFEITKTYKTESFVSAAKILSEISGWQCECKIEESDFIDGQYTKVNRPYIQVHPIPVGVSKKFQILEKLGHILGKYFAYNVDITHFDIGGLKELLSNKQTLDQLQRMNPVLDKQWNYDFFYKDWM